VPPRMNKKSFRLTSYQWVQLLYILVAVAMWVLKLFHPRYNNFNVFRGSFYNLVNHVNLYAAHPAQHYDYYYYGPLFGLFFAPFALPPKLAGLLLWELANAVALLAAVAYLPLDEWRKKILLLLCVIEFTNSAFSEQFNPMITAGIIVTFVLIEKGKDGWATLLIVLGTLMKLYPVVGLAFFLFSKNKGKFIIYTAMWTVVLLALPLLFTSFDFLTASYREWLPAVSHKNMINHDLLARSQDICVMGIVRDFTRSPNIPDLPFLIGAAVIFALPLLRFSQYKSEKFRLQVLATSLIMVVIFSTGAESPTFIIPLVGISLWLMMQKKPFSRANIVLIVFLLILTGLGLSDVMPVGIRRDIIGKYGMKAWPCIVAWLIITYQLLFKDFTAEDTPGETVVSKKRLV